MPIMPRLLILLAGLGLVGTVSAQVVVRQLAVEVAWQANVTNAEREVDRLGGLQWRNEIRAERRWIFADGHRAQGAVGARTEWWPRFGGLNVIAPGLAAGWEFKKGLGPNRPVWAAEIETEWAVAQERARSGGGGVGRLQVRQRLSGHWALNAGHEWRRFDARSLAFDRTGREWFGRVEWAASAVWTLTVEGRDRTGGVVSYSRPPRPDLVALGKPVTLVNTFEQSEPWIAYYFGARTRSAAIELHYGLGRSSLAWRYEYRHTRHGGAGYKNQIASLSFAAPF